MKTETNQKSRLALLSILDDQKQTLEALRKSEERFRRILKNSPDIIYRFRIAPTPGFEFVSDAVTTITGYTPEDHYADPELGMRMVHPEDLPSLLALYSGTVIKNLHTVRWVRKDGTIIWI